MLPSFNFSNLIIGYFILIFIFVIIPGFKNIRKIRGLLKQRKIWESLGQNVGELILEIVQHLPDPTRFVLRCVLTNRPGKGKSHAIPGALEYLGAELDAPLRSIRSCSYLSVLLGLLGTVMFIAITFWGVEDIKSVKPGLLTHIYSVNFLAILFAAIIYALYIYYRHSGDQLLLVASQTLGSLQTDLQEGVDPHLVAALESVGQKFSEWGEDIYVRHQQQLRELVDEMHSLGNALREMVQDLVAAQRTEVEGIVPLLRSQDEKIELLSQRLDKHYQDLVVGPLVKIEPLLEAWGQRTEELKQAVHEIRQADLEGNIKALAQATDSLAASVIDLPRAIREQFRGVKKELSAGLGQALRQSWLDFMMPEFQALRSSLTALTEKQESLRGAIDQFPETLATNLVERMRASWLETLEPAFRHLAESQAQILKVLQAFEQAVERLPDTVKQAMAMSLLPLTRMNAELTNRLKELLEQLSRLQELPETLPKAIQECLPGMETNISKTVSQALIEFMTQAPLINFLQESLQILSKEQQKLVQHFELLTTQLPATLEKLGTQVSEKITQKLYTLIKGTGDGYLQDILDVLKSLQSEIKNLSKETSSAENSPFVPPW